MGICEKARGEAPISNFVAINLWVDGGEEGVEVWNPIRIAVGMAEKRGHSGTANAGISRRRWREGRGYTKPLLT